MTLMKAGALIFLAGIGLIYFAARTELQTIYGALSKRFRTGVGLIVGGLAVMLVGARLQGQIVLRSLKRRYQPQIDELRRRIGPLVEVIKKAVESSKSRPGVGG
jgi:hypothetical protein